MKILHNPRCSKSRQALTALQEKGAEIEIVEYLKNPPSAAALKKILKLMGKKPEEIIRKNEALFKEKYKGKTFKDDEWIKILAENPVLIERPIVYTEKKAVLG
ncbi:MAG: arsenate reductase (glutaredoxin), partial [Spirochaetia bacterium]|nr:arsenate reductase (glutaredoxin) [Spirochaetia bacterium]